ncbi:MAG: hypothetical protein N2117_13455 [Anaerolineales bacterium]|nr:hypothetical protein [Anaerolineales bacterium]MCX7756231.1 hypothetical protein [Anaerolineales bacterium]MDW8277409.1 hypothetical protein [Anaerolineales bacterium]
MRRLWILTLIFVLSACATPPTISTATAPSTAPETPAAGVETVQAPQPTPQATSRGDQLVASDPASVQVGMGKPVLLEFFRFT